jgi:hypothetical protein
MKTSAVDADIVIRDKVAALGLTDPYSFNPNTFEDASPSGLGNLLAQNAPFFLFSLELPNSYRTGPAITAPTRYEGDLTISYFTKNPSHVVDSTLMEQTANNFAEQTIEDVRFRTYTPFPPGVRNGFTRYDGVIDLQFELYRGDRT